MKAMTAMVMGLAVAVAAGGLWGCEADESAPTRPRTENLLTPGANEQDNAAKRVDEMPRRELPPANPELPGQSRANPNALTGGQARVATLAADGIAYPFDSRADRRLEADQYRDNIPYLPVHPTSVPMAGSTHVAGTAWDVDFSWGEGLPLANYPHRAWPDKTVTYQSDQIKHNPTYYWYFQDFVPATKGQGTYAGDWLSTAYEVPWFYVNTAILPALMVLQEPFAQVRTERPGTDPVYLGYLPPTGKIEPSPVHGQIEWDYPFLRTGPQARQPGAATEPATTPTPGVTLMPQITVNGPPNSGGVNVLPRSTTEPIPGNEK